VILYRKYTGVHDTESTAYGGAGLCADADAAVFATAADLDAAPLAYDGIVSTIVHAAGDGYMTKGGRLAWSWVRSSRATTSGGK
jgi:hypothetical protein